MNIYRGCSHGCIYCDSRSDCFRVPNFDTVAAKENALEIIRNELRRKVKTGVVGVGAMSDVYNPWEAKLKLTRHTLELLNAFGFGASFLTKSTLVTRDVDILGDIKAHSPVMVSFTITTPRDDLSQIIEPYVASTSQRLEALSVLAGQGIFTGVMINPVLPFITDSPEDMVKLLYMAKEAGVKFVYAFMQMTLRPGSREYYYQKLDQHFPGLRGEYIKRYGNRKYLSSPQSKKLWEVYTKTCNDLGLLYEMKAITHAYKSGYEPLTLF